MTSKKAVFESLVRNEEGFYDVKPEELKKLFSSCHVVDVRRPDEWISDLGHVSGVQFAPLETDLMKFLDAIPASEKDDTWVFICRSGGRSGRATAMAHQKGLTNAYNMMGGMMRWNALGFEVSRTKPAGGFETSASVCLTPKKS